MKPLRTFLLAVNGKKYLLPIEWKYTEHYNNTDKSIEDSDKKSIEYKKGDEVKGKKRLDRYCYNKKGKLIDNSDYLETLPNYRSSVYFFEPFYQLMRQTLWAEQMIRNKDKEIIKADDFIHVHVIPKENHDLLKDNLEMNKRLKGYLKPDNTRDSMEKTWKSCLKDENKYIIISPQELLANINSVDLKNYLEKRYW